MIEVVQRATIRQCWRSFALATAFCWFASTASAQVQVEGDPTALRVTTNRDSISDVLSAFATLNVKFRTTTPLTAPADATYSGSFGQVIARLLDGYNYVIKNERETTEIVVFGRRGAVAVPPPAPKESPKGVLSRWR